MITHQLIRLELVAKNDEFQDTILTKCCQMKFYWKWSNTTGSNQSANNNKYDIKKFVE